MHETWTTLKSARERCQERAPGNLRCWSAADHPGPHWWLRDDAGRVAPIAPDPERDRRRAAYAARQRAAVRKALDEWFQEVAEAGEWAYPGDLLTLMNNYAESNLQQNGHYGVPPREHVRAADLEPGESCPGCADGRIGTHRNPDDGVRCGAPDVCYLTDCARDASGACPRQQNPDSVREQ